MKITISSVINGTIYHDGRYLLLLLLGKRQKQNFPSLLRLSLLFDRAVLG